MIQGEKVTLIPATLEDRQKVYEWCFHSQTTKSHSGPPDYPEIPIPDYEEFSKDYYEDYFFTGTRPQDGRGYLITNSGEPVGFISYSAFHVKPSVAELDIWMNCEANCGKGFGVDAIVALADFLHKTLHIRELIIAPARKNERAVRSYKKARFEESDKAMHEYLLEEYVPLYGTGDYGVDGTALLVKRYNA